MSVRDLILDLESVQGKIKVEDGQLRINAPEGVLTPELLKKLKDQKGDIITYLNDYHNGHPTPIVPTARQEHYLVSTGQKVLWVFSQLSKDQIAYNIPSAYTLEGPLDVASFTRALDTMVERHEVLRTNIVVVDGEPRQKIHDVRDFNFQCEYLDITGEERQSEVVEQIIQRQATFSFDIASSQLIRATLLKEQNEKFVFILNLHHVVSDGHSEGIFLSEIIELYNAYKAKKSNPLPALSVQYKDFAVWQNKQMSKSRLLDDERYWRAKLAPDRPVLALATDYTRPRLKTYNGKSTDVFLDPTLSRNSLLIAKQCNASPFMFLLAAVKTLLFRYSGQQDIIVGSSILGREHAEVERMIGLFVNTLPLRTRFDGSESFISLLKQVRQTVLEAFEHQAYPFERIVSEMGKDADFSRSPLFDVTVDYFDGEHQSTLQEMGELKVKSLNAELPTSQFDLSFIFTKSSTGITLSIQYNTDIFADATIQQYLSHFSHLLKSITADPSLPLSKLSVIPPAEMKQLVAQFNDTDEAFPLDKTFVDLFEDQVKKSPDAIAVVDKKTQLTYGELNVRANQLARLLTQKGIQPEELVPILCERSVDMLVGILGVFKAGAAYIPVDLEFPARRVVTMLNDSKSRIMLSTGTAVTGRESFFAQICSETLVRDLVVLDTVEDLSMSRALFYESFLSMISQGGKTMETYQGLRLGGNAQKLEALTQVFGQVLDYNTLKEYPGENLLTKPTPANLSFVIYTSGSTGKPKGTMNEHIGMLNHCFIMIKNLSLDQQSVIAQTAPHCFDISVWQFITALLVGGKTIIYENETILLPDVWIEKVHQDNVSIIQLVPSYLSVILDIFRGGKSKAYFSRIRQLLVCGEVIKPLFVKLWFECFPNIRMANVYGPAEASDDVTMYVMDQLPVGDSILIGRPLQNCRIYILDNYDNICPIGAVGEICVSGICVGRGYLNDVVRTQAVFMEDPFRPGVRLYKTGDLGRFLPSGELEFFGRRDYQVKIRAQRIELGEIENKLVQIAGIKNAVVIDRLDDLNNKYLCAYVLVDRGGPQIRGEEIKAILRKDLPEVMIPSFVVPLFEFPLGSNGKVDRKVLPAPDSSNTADIVTASNPVEQKMLELWKRVLGSTAIGVQSNFFECGGHSLKAAMIVSRVLREFKVRIALEDLFMYPTVKELCGLIAQREKEGHNAIKKMP